MYKMIIDGKCVQGHGETEQVFNPATGEILEV